MLAAYPQVVPEVDDRRVGLQARRVQRRVERPVHQAAQQQDYAQALENLLANNY